MSIIEGKCPNCGAPLKVDTSKDAAKCEFCNTPYVTEKAVTENHNYIYNEAKQDNEYTAQIEKEKEDTRFLKMYIIGFVSMMAMAGILTLILHFVGIF